MFVESVLITGGVIIERPYNKVIQDLCTLYKVPDILYILFAWRIANWFSVTKKEIIVNWGPSNSTIDFLSFLLQHYLATLEERVAIEYISVYIFLTASWS